METVSPIPELEIRFMDEVLRNIVRPITWLRDFLFDESTVRELDVGDVQIDSINRGLQIAPFVLVNGQPINLSRGTQSTKTISTPHVAVGLPLQATKILLQRMAGETQVFRTNNSARQSRIRQNLIQQIGEDVGTLADSIDNREEWMCAKLLTGSISYTAANEQEDSFSFTTGKPAGNTITLTTGWDDATFADAEFAVLKLFDDAGDLQATNKGPALTDCVMGATASSAFSSLVNRGAFRHMLDKTIKLESGSALRAIRNWDQANGLVYHGVLKNIRVWTYKNDAGTGTPLIRDHFVEFISAGGMSERRFYYGALEDQDAILNGVHITRRFTKTLKGSEGYNTSLKQIMAARPLPVFRRPNWFVSADVIAAS